MNPLRDNTAERIYGGDLHGNVWRFDINDALNAAGREATLVAQVVDPSSIRQPISTRPELAEVGGEAYVYVGSGRYLGPTDLATTNQLGLGPARHAGRHSIEPTCTNLRKMVITPTVPAPPHSVPMAARPTAVRPTAGLWICPIRANASAST